MDFSLFGGGIDVLPEFDKDNSNYGLESQRIELCPKLDSDFKDILDMSLEESGLETLGEIMTGEKGAGQPPPHWGDDTDEFLRSMLTGSEISTEVDLGLHSDSTGLSDTSSDSGVVELDPYRRTLLSPGLDDGPSTLMSPGSLSSCSSSNTSFGNFTTTTTSLGKNEVRGLSLVDYIGGDTSSTGQDEGVADPMFTVDPLKIDSMDLEPMKFNVGQVANRQQVPVQTNFVQQKSFAPVAMNNNNNTMTNSSQSMSNSTPVHTMNNPVHTINTLASLDPLVSTSTGTTTIILPAIGAHTATTIPVTAANAAAGIGMTFTSHRLAPRDPGPLAKRRRVSASSTDSGLEDNKYPRLEMNDEELKMAAKEGMTFPKFYPLTREEERNLKKIRRKIRNKLSAQDSRKRKREYLDSMEDRVKVCNDENDQLKEKIEALETQNKTLAAQLRRLHQMVVSGGSRNGQTSTALMVLLLSTALFLIPGLGSDQGEAKPEIDIQAAIKMPPLPGQSRSLLQFTQDNTNTIADLNDFVNEEEMKVEPASIETVTTSPHSPEMSDDVSPPQMDHDYATLYTLPGGQTATIIKQESGKAWIEQDAPPLGYGSAVLKYDEDRQMNVNVSSSGQGTRTVVLQIPKGIQ